MHNRIWKIGLPLFFVVFFLASGGLIAFRLIKNEPPVEEMKTARENISMAKKNDATNYAKNLLDRSTVLYDSAMFYWNRENERFILFRDYSRAKTLAAESIKLSVAASEKAAANSLHLKNELRIEIAELNKRISGFKSKFDFIPDEKLWKQFNKGKLAFEEGRASFENNQLVASKKKLAEAEPLIEKCYQEAVKSLGNYFKQYSEWHQTYTAAINASRKGKTAVIIVDKFARECLLVDNGKVTERFAVELGKNWMGSKNHSGDMSTPEGNYKIIDKKQNGRTKYYKALLLNYPNDEDKKRFHENKKNGVISKNKSIGGLIEIHGGGGQGADWTDGCIALSNADMDKLYAKVKVETPVVIVGSLTPLDALLK